MAYDNGVLGLDAIEHDVVRAGLNYWRKLKGSRSFPARKQIVPRELGDLMRNAVLVEVIDGGEEYQYRIFGGTQAQAMGFNMQGSYIRDFRRVWPAMAEPLYKIYGRAVQTGKPFVVRAVRDDCPGLNPVAAEHVVLPMGKDDSRVDHILIFSAYTRAG